MKLELAVEQCTNKQLIRRKSWRKTQAMSRVGRGFFKVSHEDMTVMGYLWGELGKWRYDRDDNSKMPLTLHEALYATDWEIIDR